MARSIGKTFLLQASGVAGAGVNFTTLAELQTNSFSINNTEVDVSSKDSGHFRDLLTAGAITSVEMSGEGIFTTSSDAAFVRDASLYGSPSVRFRMFDSDGTGDAIEGDFQITSYELTGEQEGATTYSISLASTGPVTIASGIA